MWAEIHNWEILIIKCLRDELKKIIDIENKKETDLMKRETVYQQLNSLIQVMLDFDVPFN